MKEKAVGEVDCLKGMLDGEPYNIFAMKEPNYSMKLMSHVPHTLKNSSTGNGLVLQNSSTNNIDASELDVKKRSGHFARAHQEFGSARTASQFTFVK